MTTKRTTTLTMAAITPLVLFSWSCSEQRGNLKDLDPIPVADLNERPVIGKLGIPLGDAAEIQAEVVAGRELGCKIYAYMYLLRVTHVDGTKLDDPPILEFYVHGLARVELARTPSDLHRMKTGKETRELDTLQVQELEQRYIGKKVRLLVWESGGFSGMPRGLPEGTALWQDYAFSFSTYLVVFAERE